MARCTICDKKSVAGNTVSHSQIHTKRRFKPNLQKVNGLVLCTRCLKTIKKFENEMEHEHTHIDEVVKEKVVA